MPLWVVKMLKKRLGIEAIEIVDWDYDFIYSYYKIPSTLVIPEGCKKIGKYVFYECWNLKKVVIPGSVDRIGDAAFYGCDDAEVIIEKLESEFKRIGDQAFWECKSVKYAEEETRS